MKSELFKLVFCVIGVIASVVYVTTSTAQPQPVKAANTKEHFLVYATDSGYILFRSESPITFFEVGDVRIERDHVMKLYDNVNSPNKKSVAIKLASACEAATGDTAEEVLADFQKLRIIALGNDRETWRSFLVGLGDLLDRLDRRDAAAHKKTLAAVGASLRRAAQ